MTPATLVEGGAEFFVHVTAGLDRVAKGVGHAVDRASALDLTGTAEGGDATGLVVLGGALVAVLKMVGQTMRARSVRGSDQCIENERENNRRRRKHK